MAFNGEGLDGASVRQLNDLFKTVEPERYPMYPFRDLIGAIIIWTVGMGLIVGCMKLGMMIQDSGWFR